MRGALLLQKAIVAKLKADTAVSAAVGTSIFDKNAGPEVFPCVTIGEDQVIVDSATLGPPRSGGVRSFDIIVTVHVWSRGAGLAGAKSIADAVEDCLNDRISVYPEGDVGNDYPRSLFFDGARFLRDPDGVTAHAVLTFTCHLCEVRS